MISTRGRYALRIMLDLAENQGEEGYLPLKEIAERQDISEKYLESIVRELVKRGVVAGQRGKGGGYRLCAKPEEINVGDVLRGMEGSLAPVACLTEGATPCQRASACRTLEFWRGLNEVIGRYTAGYTIADMMRTGQDGDDYII